MMATLAAWMFVHATLLIRAASPYRASFGWLLRFVLALVLPPLGPVLAFRAGARARPLLWLALALAYGLFWWIS